jgi:hypothetical protein
MPQIVKAPLSLPYLKPLQVRANFRRTKTPAILHFVVWAWELYGRKQARPN